MRGSDRKILVFDLPAKCFDVSIIAFNEGRQEVLSCNGQSDTGDLHDLDEVLQLTRKPCLQALRDAQIQSTQLDAIDLAGERTQDRRTVQHVEELFGLTPETLFDPEEIVAVGAAIWADFIAQQSG
ncbi:MAG: Hsp70 family protein [Candidatus Hydrogenedentes bacterium]|nr:Hsp70 family protein [Candidatus Hydrogenedentota bacterium]